MDDWSTIPNHRNADSEPAPNHHRTLNTPDDLPASARRVKRPHPAPINHAATHGA
jgi:hypothetical protein